MLAEIGIAGVAYKALEFSFQKARQVIDEGIAHEVVKNKSYDYSQWQIEPKHPEPGVAVMFMLVKPDKRFKIGYDTAYYQAG